MGEPVDPDLDDDEATPEEEPPVPTVVVPTRFGDRRVPEANASHWSELVWHDRPPR